VKPKYCICHCHIFTLSLMKNIADDMVMTTK
jgi:hypothetical protein